MKLTYKPLGSFIHEVDVRNADLAVTKLMGVNLNKEMMPSVANIIGTDLSNYKIVTKNQFACKLMSVGRDACLPIALKKDDEPVIISSAYYAFEVNNENEILSDYLMMCFSRPIFDKELWFKTGGDVRGGITWDDFSNTKIPYVDIESQKKIVQDFKVLEERIKILNEINRKLWDILLLKYNCELREKEFKTQKLEELCTFQEGYVNPTQDNPEFFDGKINWLRAGDVNESYVLNTERTLTETGFYSAGKSAILFKPGTIMITKSGIIGRLGILNIPACGNRAVINISIKSEKNFEWIYLYLKANQKSISELATGSAQRNLYVPIIQNLVIKMPSSLEMAEFHDSCKFIFKSIKNNCEEINCLEKLSKKFLEINLSKEVS